MIGQTRPRRLLDGAAVWPWRLGLALLACAGFGGAAAAQSVPTYHGSADRSGLYVTPALSWTTAANVHPDTAFNGTIAGNVYAQPLYWLPPGAPTGRVIVATESNVVYSLNATTGAVVWQRPLGTPVTGGLPCGDIDPMGITGTPVIDPGSGALYLDAMVQRASGPKHMIFAIDLANGSVLPGWPVDVAAGIHGLDRNFTVPVQGQRSALTIVEGQVFVSYGGLAGDCVQVKNGVTEAYHGVVVQLPVGSPTLAGYWRTRAQKGGIWSQGGIAYDGASMFVTTGNAPAAPTWGDSETIFRLKPGLTHYSGQFNSFTPSNWQTLDQNDQDLGGTGPLPIDVPGTGGATLPRLLQLGKDGNAYLVDRAKLGGMGGQLAVAKVSPSAIITAPARFPTASAAMVVFTGTGARCPTGQSGSLTMLQITDSPSTPITTAWCSNPSGGGAPVVTTTDGAQNPIVWVADTRGGGQLRGFRGTDGAPLYASGPVLGGLQQWMTILVAQRHFYIAGTGKVYAFTW